MRCCEIIVRYRLAISNNIFWITDGGLFGHKLNKRHGRTSPAYTNEFNDCLMAKCIVNYPCIRPSQMLENCLRVSIKKGYTHIMLILSIEYQIKEDSNIYIYKIQLWSMRLSALMVNVNGELRHYLFACKTDMIGAEAKEYIYKEKKKLYMYMRILSSNE